MSYGESEEGARQRWSKRHYLIADAEAQNRVYGLLSIMITLNKGLSTIGRVLWHIYL